MIEKIKNSKALLAAVIVAVVLVVGAVAGAIVFFATSDSTLDDNPFADRDVMMAAITGTNSYDEDDEDEKEEEDTQMEWLSERNVTEADIQGKTSLEIRIMRNSIYARHGRRFKSPYLQRYFNSLSWYKPVRDEIPAYELNKYEKHNIYWLKARE